MIDALGNPQSLLLVGGTSEIGLAIAQRLLRDRGGRLVLAGRDRAHMEDAARALSRDLPAVEVEVVHLDLTTTNTHDGVLSDVFSPGDVDVAVLAAGVLGDQRRAEVDPGDAVAVAQVNYVGTMSVALHVAMRMEGQGHGVIVVLSSVAGLRGRRSNYVYGSSKAGIDVFSQGLADRLHGSGVRLVTVRPGFVRTRMTAGLEPAPLAVGPYEVAEDTASAVVGRADVVYVPPALRWVMIGLRALPGGLFRRLDL